MMIDLRSDTVTKPTPAMLDFMLTAKVGDDVFGEDPCVNNLEEELASVFGMEAALFCPTGTMTNQIAVKVHTSPGDEVICDRISHIYCFEGGGVAFNSGASVRLLHGNRGRFTAAMIEENINPENDHYPVSRLVCAENTVNRGGGAIWDTDSLKEIAAVCSKHKLSFHLDGARLFNAIVESGEDAVVYGDIFDSISICLSKSLGCPAGSVLIGSSEFIKKSRRVRKVFGGGMRQVGYLAAAGIYALSYNINRLKEDHFRALELKKIISDLPYAEDIMPVETNIIIFNLCDKMNTADFTNKLNEKGLKVLGIADKQIRMVTHLDFNDDDLEMTENILKNVF